MAVLDQLRHLLVEERDQQRGDVGAVDVGIGHDDDALVAQVLVAIFGAGADAERLDQVRQQLVLRQLLRGGVGDVEDLAAQRQYRLRFAVARLLAEPPAESPSTMKISVPAASGSSSRRACRAGAACALPICRPISFSRRRFRRSSAWSTVHSSSLVACCGQSASQWSKASRTALSTMRVASAVASLSLVWPWNSGSRMNTDSMAAAVPSTSSAVICGALVADALAEVAQPLAERRAQAVLVRAAFGRGDGVAVGVREAVLVGDPATAHSTEPWPPSLSMRPAKMSLVTRVWPSIVASRYSFKPPGKWNVASAGVSSLISSGAHPADLDAAEQVGLGARHAEQARRLEGGALAENLLVRLEAHLGAAPVLDRAELFQLALRRAAREHHGVELLAARHLHLEHSGQRVDDRDADAVQAARGVVDLAVEFAARVQRRHDDFERGLALELGVRIDRDAAAVVGDRQKSVRRKLDLDPGGMAGHRLVHGVVDHLGEQVMQRLLVGAADVHAGPAADRLEAFQHLDVMFAVAAVLGRLSCARRFYDHFAVEFRKEVSL